MKQGFTLIELLVVFGCVGVLGFLATVSLLGGQRRAVLVSATDPLIGDLRSQQTRAMTGDAGGMAAMDSYGIYFGPSAYIAFRGDAYATASASNFSTTYPTGITMSTTSPNNQVVFAKGSGEIVNFSSLANTIIIQQAQNNTQIVLTLNKLGSVEAMTE